MQEVKKQWRERGEKKLFLQKKLKLVYYVVVQTVERKKEEEEGSISISSPLQFAKKFIEKRKKQEQQKL